MSDPLFDGVYAFVSIYAQKIITEDNWRYKEFREKIDPPRIITLKNGDISLNIISSKDILNLMQLNSSLFITFEFWMSHIM